MNRGFCFEKDSFRSCG